MTEQGLLSLTGVGKSFPGCIANDNIDLDVAAGEIHALLGENGAGKSTLVKIIYGVLRPDQGNIRWQGKVTRIENPAQARSLGIGMVFQHFSLFEAMTTLENIALALPPEDPEALRARLEETARVYGLALQPDRHVYDLSMGERQRIEIVRCLLQNPQLLILDEPTSVLTPQETDILFETLRMLAQEGRAILYISHKLEEVRALCDRATILRGGRRVDDCLPAQETARSLAEKMIGKKIQQVSRQSPIDSGSSMHLAVSDLNVRSDLAGGVDLTNISLEVRAGEVLGVEVGGLGDGLVVDELLGAHAGDADHGQAPVLELLRGHRRKVRGVARPARLYDENSENANFLETLALFRRIGAAATLDALLEGLKTRSVDFGRRDDIQWDHEEYRATLCGNQPVS